jgi:hypothetical protein
LFAKLKGIALGVMTVGAIVTGAVLAQVPTPTPKPAAPGGHYTIADKPSDPDRLHAVEQKLDRILEALGGARQAATSSYSISAAPHLMPTPAAAVSTTRFTPSATSSSNSSPVTTPAPAATTVTHFESTDRLLTMERRLANVERRLHELERRLNATHAPSALPSAVAVPAVPAGADNAPTAEERVP